MSEEKGGRSQLVLKRERRFMAIEKNGCMKVRGIEDG